MVWFKTRPRAGRTYYTVQLVRLRKKEFQCSSLSIDISRLVPASHLKRMSLPRPARTWSALCTLELTICAWDGTDQKVSGTTTEVT